MDYRLTRQELFDVLAGWNRFLRRKVHLIACGGTALTLMGIKESTKDVDFMVPVVSEHDYLIRALSKLGYSRKTGSGWCKKGEVFIFDLFPGNSIHTTELLKSPLEEGKHHLLKEFSRIYIGILNEYDLISSKLFRGTPVDFDDCLALVAARQVEIDLDRLRDHFKELAGYDVSEERILKNLDMFFARLAENGLLS
jgi:hypothetical protein